MKEQIAGAKNNKKLVADDPLIDESGQKIMPNVTRVFRPGQKMSVYLELYDPGVLQFPAQARSESAGIASVTASVAFYQGDKKVMETPAVRVNRINAKRPGVVPLRLQTLLKSVAGRAICLPGERDRPARTQIRVPQEFDRGAGRRGGCQARGRADVYGAQSRLEARRQLDRNPAPRFIRQ